MLSQYIRPATCTSLHGHCTLYADAAAIPRGRQVYSVAHRKAVASACRGVMLRLSNSRADACARPKAIFGSHSPIQFDRLQRVVARGSRRVRGSYSTHCSFRKPKAMPEFAFYALSKRTSHLQPLCIIATDGELQGPVVKNETRSQPAMLFSIRFVSPSQPRIKYTRTHATEIPDSCY